MNLLSSLMPAQNQMRSPLSDEELQRLAAMLQEKGEGLAAINPEEAQMLKDAGGSGQALPGTMGLGVGGGPIRSYAKGRGGPGDKSSSGSKSQSSQSRGGLESSKSKQNKQRTSIDKQFETDPRQRVQDMMNESNNRNNDNNNRPPPPPPKPRV